MIGVQADQGDHFVTLPFKGLGDGAERQLGVA